MGAVEEVGDGLHADAEAGAREDGDDEGRVGGAEHHHPRLPAQHQDAARHGGTVPRPVLLHPLTFGQGKAEGRRLT